MASIGHITAAAASARQDNTLALANFNFEISLFTKRITPPTEYEGVGKHLSEHRLKEAQDGAQHTMARKLGLLFKNILPHTPELIKAYGSRASEVTQAAKAEISDKSSSYGPFSNTIGVDATALWAAATSGHAAIQCHLLACMLARSWDGPEATSLWDEIIQRRKLEVRQTFENEGEVGTDLMRAASERFPRSDLANWDASCRSWLRVADSIKSSPQTKLRLIVDNLDLSVNNKPDTYESVKSAWTTAMTELEKLLIGTPRSVQGGEVLLGLMAWHLYPDLECLSAQTPRVELKDPLFFGRGILTIGLDPAPGREPRAVYWTLPLAHLRYYGLPVSRFCSTRTSERDRITVDELLFAWFCAYIKAWDSDRAISTKTIMEFVGETASRLQDVVNETQSKDSTDSELLGGSARQSDSWLLLLSRIARHWAARLGEDRSQTLRNLGRGFCNFFTSPFQNIFNINTYLDVALEIEDKIRLLRQIALHLSAQMAECPGYTYLIAYQYRYENSTESFEIATALSEFDCLITDLDAVQTSRLHRRWLGVHSSTTDPLSAETTEKRLHEIRAQNEEAGYHSRPYPIFSKASIYQESGHNTSLSSKRSVQVVEVNGPRRRSRPEPAPLTMQLPSSEKHRYDVIFGDIHGTALLRRRPPGQAAKGAPIIHQTGAQVRPKNTEPSYTLSTRKLLALFQPHK